MFFREYVRPQEEPEEPEAQDFSQENEADEEVKGDTGKEINPESQI